MHELIEKIYDSDISKMNEFHHTPEMSEYYDKSEKIIEDLKNRLSSEDAKLLSEHADPLDRMIDKEKRRAFLCGLQTGARLMIEIFNDD